MQFLKILFWVVVAIVATIFAVNNWRPVEINLWGGLKADIKLPVLMGGAFLLGFLPWFILHKATRWRLRRTQRQLEEARGGPSSTMADEPNNTPLPGAAPIAVPPAG
jgi:lipopolysaccharide assembly protein A